MKPLRVWALAKNITLQQLKLMYKNRNHFVKNYFSNLNEICCNFVPLIYLELIERKKNSCGMMCKIAQGKLKLSSFHAISKCVNCYWLLNIIVDESKKLLRVHSISYHGCGRTRKEPSPCTLGFLDNSSCQLKLSKLIKDLPVQQQHLQFGCW